MVNGQKSNCKKNLVQLKMILNFIYINIFFMYNIIYKINEEIIYEILCWS